MNKEEELAHLHAPSADPKQRQVDYWGRRAEKAEDARDGLLAALESLAKEVRGCWIIAEQAIRADIGNTNYQVVLDKLDTAFAAIAKARNLALTPNPRRTDR